MSNRLFKFFTPSGSDYKFASVVVVDAEGNAVSGVSENKDFMQNVAEGNVPNYKSINKFGENPDIDSAAAEDVWDGGGLYNFSTIADIDRISSSNVLDVQKIEVYGLDANYQEIEETVTLNGQTPVVLANTYLRVYRMKNVDSVDVAGVVYCFVNTAVVGGVPSDLTKVRANIRNGNNQTLMAVYTIPAGKTGYYQGGFIAMSRASDASADFTLRARAINGVFQVKRRVSLNSGGSSHWNAGYLIPVKYEEKTDILIRCDSVSGNNTGVSAGFTILLKDN